MGSQSRTRLSGLHFHFHHGSCRGQRRAGPRQGCLGIWTLAFLSQLQIKGAWMPSQKDKRAEQWSLAKQRIRSCSCYLLKALRSPHVQKTIINIQSVSSTYWNCSKTGKNLVPILIFPTSNIIPDASEVLNKYLLNEKKKRMNELVISFRFHSISPSFVIRNSFKYAGYILDQVGSVQFSHLSLVRLFVTTWTAACQVSLSITNSPSLLKLMSIELVIPSNHLILCHPLLLPQSFPASESFPLSQFFASGGRSIGASASGWIERLKLTNFRYYKKR